MNGSNVMNHHYIFLCYNTMYALCMFVSFTFQIHIVPFEYYYQMFQYVHYVMTNSLSFFSTVLVLVDVSLFCGNSDILL